MSIGRALLPSTPSLRGNGGVEKHSKREMLQVMSSVLNAGLRAGLGDACRTSLRTTSSMCDSFTRSNGLLIEVQWPQKPIQSAPCLLQQLCLEITASDSRCPFMPSHRREGNQRFLMCELHSRRSMSELVRLDTRPLRNDTQKQKEQRWRLLFLSLSKEPVSEVYAGDGCSPA